MCSSHEHFIIKKWTNGVWLRLAYSVYRNKVHLTLLAWVMRLAPSNWFKPSRKIFYWPFQGGTSFVDLYVFVLSCVCYVFVRVCLYLLCGHLLGKGWPLGSRLWCLLWVCHFPIGILGHVWYLIVSIPDLCTLTYFYKWISKSLRISKYVIFLKMRKILPEAEFHLFWCCSSWVDQVLNTFFLI